MSRTVTKDSGQFDLLAFAESLRRPGAATSAREHGISRLVAERCPIASTRAGVPLPTLPVLRDLQLVTPSGANVAGVQANPLTLLAGAARPQTLFERAGIARVTINDAQTASLPRWRGDGGGWIIEGQALSEADLSFSTVSAVARMCGAHVSFSRRLRLSTSGSLQDAVVAELGRQVRVALETGFITGSNSGGEPLGLLAQAEGAASFAGATPTWAEVLGMMDDLGDADGDLSDSVFFTHPKTAVAMLSVFQTANSDDGLAEFKDRQWTIAGLPAFTSTVVPEGTVVLMDRRAVNPVYFGPPMLIANPYSGSNSVTGRTTIVVMNYADLAVSEPALVIVGQ